jgi:hypothetical protein
MKPDTTIPCAPPVPVVGPWWLMRERVPRLTRPTCQIGAMACADFERRLLVAMLEDRSGHDPGDEDRS